MANIHQNLLDQLPNATATEVVDKLLSASGLRVERIVSHGQSSPDDYWYDQDEAEWVMVLSGSARLEIEGEADARALGPGDAVYLPPHCRHRVARTDPDQATVWLVIFVDPELQPIPHFLAG